MQLIYILFLTCFFVSIILSIKVLKIRRNHNIIGFDFKSTIENYNLYKKETRKLRLYGILTIVVFIFGTLIKVVYGFYVLLYNVIFKVK